MRTTAIDRLVVLICALDSKLCLGKFLEFPSLKQNVLFVDSYQFTYSLVEFVDSSPKLIDNMAVKANEEKERDDEDDDGHSTKV